MSTIHRTDNGFIQYTKGAPDEVLRRCTSYTESGQILPLTEEKRTAILAENKAMLHLFESMDFQMEKKLESGVYEFTMGFQKREQ